MEIWPYNVPLLTTFSKANVSRTGGRSLSGTTFVVNGQGGYWRATGKAIVHRREATLAFRGFYAATDGMATPILVPCFTKDRPVDRSGRMVPAAMATSLLPGFSDNSGIGSAETPIMWTVGPGTLRDTRITVSHPGVPAIRPGHYFGIGERLYLVARQWQIEREEVIRTEGGALTYGNDPLAYGAEPLAYGSATIARTGSNTSIVEFWPPLREDVAGGTALILGRPVCKMRLASDDSGALDMGLGVYGEATLEFEEA